MADVRFREKAGFIEGSAAQVRRQKLATRALNMTLLRPKTMQKLSKDELDYHFNAAYLER